MNVLANMRLSTQLYCENYKETNSPSRLCRVTRVLDQTRLDSHLT